MADVMFVAVLIAFFGMAAVFVRACDRIIGVDLEVVDGEGAEEPLPELDAA